MSLFPSGPRNLIEFRAGKLFRDENLLKPDVRKGLVYAYVADDLLHICWKNRKTNETEDDWILFPDDAVFEKVPQCTTGRVFVLKIASAETKAFFWMQEPKTDKDDEYAKSLNNLINSPGGGGFTSPGFGFGGQDAMAQEQIYQMIQNASGGSQTSRSQAQQSTSTPAQEPAASTSNPAPASAPAPAPAQASSSAPTTSDPSSAPLIPLSHLQSILSGVQIPAQKLDVDLTKLLNLEHLSSLLSDPLIQERLFPFIPDKAERTKEELEDIIRSPQFIQAVASLNEGLRSGQLAPLIAELDLDPSVGGPLGGVEAFLRAIQAKVEQKKKEGK